MVSFRFHIVSIVAVFLALALGIGMGVTVIDKATVDLLQQRLNAVRGEVQAANQRSDQLQTELGRTERFDEVANDYLIGGRLNGNTVTVVSVRGVNGDTQDRVRQTLQEAGAQVQGTLWFTAKTNLTNNSDVDDLRRALELQTDDRSALRQALLVRVSAVLAGAAGTEQLSALVTNGFLEWDPVGQRNLTQVSFGSGKTVVLSSVAAGVSNDDVAIPLARQLAAQPSRRVVAADVGRPPAGNQAEIRGAFVDPLRRDDALNDRLSTVDNVESARGRVALVLALRNLDLGIVGDYGVASSAESPLPPLQQ